jgi:hypothetical protein
MSNKILGLGLGAPLIACLMYTSSIAQEDVSEARCETTPEAITTLPEPLNRWAAIVCTESGYVITGRKDWIWIEPRHNALVIIPSQSYGRHAETKDGSSYFTRVEFTKVTGDEFDKAYEIFHTGFDPKDAKPSGYRLDVTTMAGNDIRLYLFDYFTYGWGMACSKDACDASSRFVMLNMKQDPKPLPQPI